MNFFERQDAARRMSRRLVLLFSVAVAAVVVAVDVVFMLAFGGLADPEASAEQLSGGLVVSTLVTLAIIGLASMYRMSSLKTGGAAVARQLGATPVPEDARDFHMRRLRNVVEEIAIASGVPVPQIFVLEEEAGINAFAAGYSPADAAIAVTRGALDRLNRDELQGVIAHEFSHVLNGDMRLNIRLMGVLFGILVLGIVGRKVLQHGRGARGKGAAPILLAALGLMIIGWVGMFFGRVIKAGVSRHRELLADASAVQFTRQTRGLAGALKKIGGLHEGSKLGNAEKEEVSHMLFGDGIGYSRLFATHPPLLERIHALEPAFRADQLQELAARWHAKPPSGLDEDVALGLNNREPPPLPGDRTEVSVTVPQVVAQVGAPQADDYLRAGAIVDAIPEVLQDAARERDEAIPLLFGLLLAEPGDVRERQMYELASRHDERLARQTTDYADRLNRLPRALYLPLAAMAMPVLRRRPRAELEKFMDVCFALSHADGSISLFEYCLGRLLRVHVRDVIDPAGSSASTNGKLADAREHAIALMAVLAQAGHPDAKSAQRAFIAGIGSVYPRVNSPYKPPADAHAALDQAWPVLDRLEPMAKALLLEGLVIAVSHDGRISIEESELLRVVCASLHMPLPPMLEKSA